MAPTPMMMMMMMMMMIVCLQILQYGKLSSFYSWLFNHGYPKAIVQIKTPRYSTKFLDQSEENAMTSNQRLDQSAAAWEVTPRYDYYLC